MSAYTQSTNAAYSTRATALHQAYTQGTVGAIKSAAGAAWTAFRTSTKVARMAWQSSRNSAWATFRTVTKACKAAAVPGDSGNSSSEGAIFACLGSHLLLKDQKVSLVLKKPFQVIFEGRDAAEEELARLEPLVFGSTKENLAYFTPNFLS